MSDKGYTSTALLDTQDVPGSTWTNVGPELALEPGPTIFDVQLYADLPTQRPKRMGCRWMRVQSQDGTAQAIRAVPSASVWSDCYTSVAYVDPGETWQLQVWHDAPAPVRYKARIIKTLNPIAYAASRLDIG